MGTGIRNLESKQSTMDTCEADEMSEAIGG